MKVYIAGAITDNPNYEEQFKAAEERLKERGYEVFNPAKNQGYTYREYINMGLFELMHCDAIYLLKGYENSTGATLEHDYARTVGLKIMLEEDEVQTGDKPAGSSPERDLISRGALLKILKEWADSNAMRGYDTAYDVVQECISTVENQHIVQNIYDRFTSKKPLEKSFGVMVCPDCEKTVGRRVAPDIYEEKHDFCSHCGQAINWEG